MPWWGWLILACVVIGAAAWVAVTAIAAKAAKRMNESFDRGWNDGGFMGGRRP